MYVYHAPVGEADGWLCMLSCDIGYHIVGKFGGGKFGKFGESSVIRQCKTILISTYN